MDTKNNNQNDNALGNQMLQQKLQKDLNSPSQIPPHDRKPKIEYAIIIVLLIIAAAVIYLYNHKHLSLTSPGIKPVQKHELKKVVVTPGLPEGVSLNLLAPGKLPDGFPNDLIIYPKVQNIQSSKNIVPNNELHLVVRYTVASATPEQVYQNYQAVLTSKQWAVDSSGINGKDYYLVMSNNSSNVIITIVPEDSGVAANLDYYQSK